LLARDGGVEVAPPAAHALLVGPALHAAGDVGPAKAVGIDERLELRGEDGKRSGDMRL
jgi:hypothetical protein